MPTNSGRIRWSEANQRTENRRQRTDWPNGGQAVQISHFTDLKVYQKAGDLAAAAFAHSKRWPAEERYSLTDQIRRAARSVGANISEACGKRRYEAHFVSKLTDADGENHEVEHWLLIAKRDGYLTESDFESLLEHKREVGRMLGSMILNPGPFLLK